jgi:hypothetical protein
MGYRTCAPGAFSGAILRYAVCDLTRSHENCALSLAGLSPLGQGGKAAIANRP